MYYNSQPLIRRTFGRQKPNKEDNQKESLQVCICSELFIFGRKGLQFLWTNKYKLHLKFHMFVRLRVVIRCMILDHIPE